MPRALFPPSRIASTAVGWAENRCDEFTGWGHSVWYFEVGDDGWPVRQAETYDAGRVLRYGPNHSEEPSSLPVLRSFLVDSALRAQRHVHVPRAALRCLLDKRIVERPLIGAKIGSDAAPVPE